MPSAVVPGNKSIKQVWKPGSLQGADAVAETVAAKDLNNLYRTSCFFADAERYRVFCALYSVMRIVDDRVDDVLARKGVGAEERAQERDILEAWHRIVTACLEGSSPAEDDIRGSDYPRIDELLTAFKEAIRKFPVPAVLWENFFTAMRRDLEQYGFATYSEFLEYTEGASVAPATIYLYLIAAEQDSEEDAFYPPSDFDLIQCGRQLGLFTYIGHILRDLARDLAAGDQGLLYLAADDMAAHGLTAQTLLTDLASGSSSPPLRALTCDLVERARAAAERGRACMQVLEGKLSSDRAFILELIVRIYEKVVEKIAACSYDLMADHHKLTDLEKDEIALEVAESMGLSVSLPSAT